MSLALIPKEGEMSLPCWEGHVCSTRELTRMTKTLSKKPQDRDDVGTQGSRVGARAQA